MEAFKMTSDGDWDRIQVDGNIDETTGEDLITLNDKVGKFCIFDFRNLQSINSAGVRSWINFLWDFRENRTIVFENCNPDVVTQLNMIPSFSAGVEIRSVIGVFTCQGCQIESQKVFGRDLPMPANLDEELPEFVCEKCQEKMVFEDDPHEYFAFVQREEED